MVIIPLYNAHWHYIRSIIKDKSGDEKDVKNYRPITILSLFDKILETCILNRFGCFLRGF